MDGATAPPTSSSSAHENKGLIGDPSLPGELLFPEAQNPFLPEMQYLSLDQLPLAVRRAVKRPTRPRRKKMLELDFLSPTTVTPSAFVACFRQLLTFYLEILKAIRSHSQIDRMTLDQLQVQCVNSRLLCYVWYDALTKYPPITDGRIAQALLHAKALGIHGNVWHIIDAILQADATVKHVYALPSERIAQSQDPLAQIEHIVFNKTGSLEVPAAIPANTPGQSSHYITQKAQQSEAAILSANAQADLAFTQLMNQLDDLDALEFLPPTPPASLLGKKEAEEDEESDDGYT